MKYTANMGLRKPEGGEYYSIDDFNTNVDTLDAAVSAKANKPASFTLGNLTSVGAGGNLEDSGKKPADFAGAEHSHDTAYAPISHVSDDAVHVGANEKADIAAVTSKADKSYVDSALSTKADKISVDQKADAEWVKGEIATKADIGMTRNLIINVSPNGDDGTGDGSVGNPYKTLQTAIDSLPKNINNMNPAVKLAPGTYNEDVTIQGFHGQGCVLITGRDNGVTATTKINGIITMDSCTCRIKLLYHTIIPAAGNVGSNNDGAIRIINCREVSIDSMSIDGNGKKFSGVSLIGTGNLGITTCTISNSNNAINTSTYSGTRGLSMVGLYNTVFNDCNVGILADNCIVGIYGGTNNATTKYVKSANGMVFVGGAWV